MADVNVKMGVSGISQFKQGMSEAQASVKTFDAALKANEKQLKATGNAENYMQAQTTLLNGKLEAQRNIVKNAEQALKQMEANGVRTTSKGYQEMQRRLIEAQSAMMDTQMELDGLGSKAAEASGQTDKLATSLGGIGKKLSLDQVIGGINNITNAMERAGRKAVDLGKQIWENITDAARWGDDTATQAAILGMDVEDYQAYKKVFDTVGDLTVAEWQKAKLKVQKAINDPTSEQIDILSALGISTKQWGTVAGQSGSSLVPVGWEETFWKIGQTLREKVADGLMTQDQADVYANALFGRGFAELNPIFELGMEGFKQALEDQNVVTEESVDKLASLNDRLVKLQGDFETLKQETIASLAPALEGAAKALDGMLTSVLEYLKTPEGKKALEDLGTAVSGLFDDLGKIDPQSVVEGFTGVLEDVVGAVQWLVDNKDGVVEALKWILGGWGALEVTGGVLEIVKVVQGIKGLTNTSAAAAAGEAAGASWGGGFAKAVVAAAPWLIGLYTLLNPAAGGDEIGNNTLKDEKGNLTNEAIEYGYGQTENGELYLDRREILKEAAQNAWDLYRTNQLDEAALTELQSKVMDSAALTDLYNMMMGARDGNKDWKAIEDLDLGEWADKYGMPELPVELQVPEDSAASITEQVGTVEINGVLHLVDAEGNDIGDLGDWTGEYVGGHGKRRKPKANGIWSVPFDGYSAILHKGERVVPAREVGSSRNFSSNLYIENMNMNNGQDAEGLAAAIAAANRRTMRGYGN